MNNYSAERPARREHIPLYPRGFIALRIVQLVLGVIISGLCSLGVAGLAFSGDVLMLCTVSLFRGLPFHLSLTHCRPWPHCSLASTS